MGQIRIDSRLPLIAVRYSRLAKAAGLVLMIDFNIAYAQING